MKNDSHSILKKRNLDKKVIFQQDRALSHFAKQFRAFFDGRWAGRGGLISWAPRSLNLTPLDFFMWFYQDKVYTRTIVDIDHLKRRIDEEIKSSKKKTLQNVFDCIPYRLKFCIDANGNTFEQYLWNIFLLNKTLSITLSNKKRNVQFEWELREIHEFCFGRLFMGHPVDQAILWIRENLHEEIEMSKCSQCYQLKKYSIQQ